MEWLSGTSNRGRFKVPNLEKSKAIIAGSVGDGVSCLSMQIRFGYTIGVAITGAAIGLMVALAETVFRKNWLDVKKFFINTLNRT